MITFNDSILLKGRLENTFAGFVLVVVELIVHVTVLLPAVPGLPGLGLGVTFSVAFGFLLLWSKDTLGNLEGSILEKVVSIVDAIECS